MSREELEKRYEAAEVFATAHRFTRDEMQRLFLTLLIRAEIEELGKTVAKGVLKIIEEK